MKSDIRLPTSDLGLKLNITSMKIDRHNYEEFFILYWDNELSASQKQAVENFVNENTDLQEEFNILGDTRFTPDNNIQIRDKDFFVNNSFINVTNYEEQLLNYIDDELTTEQNAEVEKAAARFPNIKNELTLLYKAKLQPESEIVFPGKSVLYRREERVRVISMTWLRVAVAAAIIIIAGLITFRLTNTDTPGDKTEVVKNNPVNIPGTSKSQPDDRAKDDDKKVPSTDLAKQNEKQETNSEQSAAAKKDQKPVKDRSANLIASDERNKNNLPIKRNDRQEQVNVSDLAANEPTENPGILEEKKDKVDAVTASINDPAVTLGDRQTSDIQTPIIDTKEKDGGGLKEFLRKTTRVFERRTKIQTTTEDNKLLVGAFAVSLK